MKKPRDEERIITEETNLMDMIQRLNAAIGLVYKPNPLCETMAKMPGLESFAKQLRAQQLSLVPVLREAVTELQNKLDHLFLLKYNVKVGGGASTSKTGR